MNFDEPASSVNGLIEVGIIIAGSLDSVDRAATSLAIKQFSRVLCESHPSYSFEIIEIHHAEVVIGSRVEPSDMLRQAVSERDTRHLDFAYVISSADLIGYYSPYCLAAVSRPLDAAVFSTSLIDPRARGVDSDPKERQEMIGLRLSRLMLHAMGHLLGLSKSEDPENYLYQVADADQLDRMHRFDDEQLARQQSSLSEIADQRLEEGSGQHLGNILFTLRAAWINRREILEAIVAARSWQFPRRLSGLTLASASTVVILMMTAEAWDLALSQSVFRIVLLVASAWIFTTVYVIIRQQLLVRHGRARSEQVVVTSLSAIGIVFTGMLVTWTTMAAVGFATSWLLFDTEIIKNWAASSNFSDSSRWNSLRVQMSFFSASLALLIGSLGASFESQHYFQHLIFVDEEV